jgi:glutamyl-tRNA reductase
MASFAHVSSGDPGQKQPGMLVLTGLSFRSAPIELREKVAFGADELAPALRALGSGVILSTCNRTEIYQEAGAPVGELTPVQLLDHRAGDARSEVRRHLYHLGGENAIRHLFAVAAGLDSMVLGEPQILGQVRAALNAAEAAGTAGPVLAHVFRQAIRVGRRARDETFIGRHAVSVSSAAVELARRVFGRLEGCRALVIGAGEMGELTVRTLAEHGVGVVAVANRTLDRARALAGRFGGEALALDDLADALAAADIVISSTDAASFVIQGDDVRRALAERGGRPLFIIDIAVPRDVDPTVRSLPGVFLYDIDDLQALCAVNRESRQREVQRVQQIIEMEVRDLLAWWSSRRVIPTIIAMRERAEQIRRAELSEALARLGHLSEADRASIEALTRAIVAKLLHRPTVRLKELAAADDEAAIELVRDLFSLEGTRERRDSAAR